MLDFHFVISDWVFCVIVQMLNCTVKQVDLIMFSRFKEGLATLNVGIALEQHPSLFRSFMCCTKTNLTADAVEDIFQVELSALGSTKRQDETRVLGYWRDYLLYVEGV